MYCQFLDISRELRLGIELLIPCDANTVLRYACEDHVIYLCEKHLKDLQSKCPYDRKKLYLSILDVSF